MARASRLLPVLVAAGLILTLATPVFSKAMGKTHDVVAEVVSADVDGKSITIKDDKGDTSTAPVMTDAMEALKSVKAGDRVTVTCQDDDKGNHQGVIAIKRNSLDKP